MLRAPGPIPPLDTSWYPTTYDTPDFSDMVAAALSPADSLFGAMDALFDPAAVFDDVLTGDTIMADLDTVDQINGDNAHLAVIDPIANIDTFKANGDAALTASIAVFPGEAFQPVPAATQYGSQPSAPVTARILSATITNLSAGRGTGFTAGDQFQIVVQMDTGTGAINDYFNVRVYINVWKDGIPQPDMDPNPTDHTGATTFTGTWQSTDTGNWSMVAHGVPVTGGDVNSPLVQWSVGGLPFDTHNPKQATVTATLFNYTSGDLGNNHVGDTWQIFVSGPANSPVYLWGTYNGASLAEVTLGNTDSFGNFNLAGKWADSEIGDWVEIYAVSHFQMVGNISFTVLPTGS